MSTQQAIGHGARVFLTMSFVSEIFAGDRYTDDPTDRARSYHIAFRTDYRSIALVPGER
jgi:hypothetical protein